MGSKLLGRSDSMRSLQLIEVQQKITRRSSCLPIPIVADDDDSDHPVDDGRAHPFCALQALKTWNHDTARRATLLTIPEPEGELAWLARNRSTDDQVLADGGDVRQPANSVAAQIQLIEISRQPGYLIRLEDAGRIF